MTALIIDSLTAAVTDALKPQPKIFLHRMQEENCMNRIFTSAKINNQIVNSWCFHKCAAWVRLTVWPLIDIFQGTNTSQKTKSAQYERQVRQIVYPATWELMDFWWLGLKACSDRRSSCRTSFLSFISRQQRDSSSPASATCVTQSLWWRHSHGISITMCVCVRVLVCACPCAREAASVV